MIPTDQSYATLNEVIDQTDIGKALKPMLDLAKAGRGTTEALAPRLSVVHSLIYDHAAQLLQTLARETIVAPFTTDVKPEIDKLSGKMLRNLWEADGYLKEITGKSPWPTTQDGRKGGFAEYEPVVAEFIAEARAYFNATPPTRQYMGRVRENGHVKELN